jgi:hypothetical protein
MNKNNKNELRFWKDGNEINFSAQGTLGKFVGSIILIISGIILYPFLLLSRLVHGKPKAKSKRVIDDEDEDEDDEDDEPVVKKKSKTAPKDKSASKAKSRRSVDFD